MSANRLKVEFRGPGVRLFAQVDEQDSTPLRGPFQANSNSFIAETVHQGLRLAAQTMGFNPYFAPIPGGVTGHGRPSIAMGVTRILKLAGTASESYRVASVTDTSETQRAGADRGIKAGSDPLVPSDGFQQEVLVACSAAARGCVPDGMLVSQNPFYIIMPLIPYAACKPTPAANAG
ncbi:hypothetical protein B0H17DRAFT_1142311 [Mycena rosella]|uniref:Uncharacterized protein n=1 Tax=Mycena rosella TaxID=1033263 RepID=A0AAD7CXD7_MYCRO|nr:hypothetical protein B0H17DRAFT_1142311 [Mycena rosella]